MASANPIATPMVIPITHSGSPLQLKLVNGYQVFTAQGRWLHHGGCTGESHESHDSRFGYRPDG